MVPQLRRRMADYGFESNDDYEFQLRSLFGAPIAHVRCLNVAGQLGRRKTAFAHALARALEYPHVLYHDFKNTDPLPPIAPLSAEEDAAASDLKPMTAFERIMIEACAYSEAANTALILDQLQCAPFAEQTGLYHMLNQGEWTTAQGSVKANAKHLLVVLISEEPLYHSLARLSYRLWTDASTQVFDHRPQDFGLDRTATELFANLQALFGALGASPTHSEFSNILRDLLHHVRGEEHLRHCLYGRMEHVPREPLFSKAADPLLRSTISALAQFVGSEEVVLDGEQVHDLIEGKA